MILQSNQRLRQLSLMPERAKGSAMVEFALLLGVMLPVGLGVAMLGKLADLTHTTEQASRYATWEATVYSRSALATQSSAVENRFYARPDNLLTSNAGDAQQQNDEGDNAHGLNPLWGTPAGNQGTLRALASVSRDAQQRVVPSYEFDTGAAPLSTITGNTVAVIARPLSGFRGNSWGLTADGLLRSGIEVAVEATPLLPGSQARCGTATEDTQANTAQHACVRSAGVILADGWAASDDAHAASRVRSLVPASAMGYVGEGLSALLGSLLFPELDPLDEAFGYVNMDVLPEYAQP